MNNPHRLNNTAIDLAAESFSCVTPYSMPLALTRGIVVEVTGWMPPGLSFGKRGYFVRVVLTARLWDAMLQAHVRQPNSEAMGKNSNDILWLAAQALERAEYGRSGAANFSMYLPSENGEDCQTLRVECLEREESEVCQVTVGFPEDFLRL